MENKYTLKIYPKGMGKAVYRVIEICGEETLDDLCDEILLAYDFCNEHLYEFCMNNKLYSKENYRAYAEGNRPSTDIEIDKLGLKEKESFLFHYDFGDDWVFVVKVEKIMSIPEYVEPQVLKSKGSIEQYPSWDDDEFEADEFEADELETEDLSPIDEYERECEEVRKVNEKLLELFEEDLSGLSNKTVRKHVENVDFYINEFLLYEEPLSFEHGITKVDDFLGNFFIRKCMWSTPGTIKTTAASIKKFYKSMLDHGKIAKKDYTYLCDMIKSGMPIWQEDCAQFNNPDQVNPFMFF